MIRLSKLDILKVISHINLRENKTNSKQLSPQGENFAEMVHSQISKHFQTGHTQKRMNKTFKPLALVSKQN